MRKEGAARQEIADRFGLGKSQIKNWINQYNRKQAKLEAGIVPWPKGRQGKMPCQEMWSGSKYMKLNGLILSILVDTFFSRDIADYAASFKVS